MSRRSLTRLVMTTAVVACVAATTLTTAAAASPQAARAESWSQLRAQFDYQRHEIRVVTHGSTHRDGAVISDISYSAPGQAPVQAYLVTPDRSGRFAAAMFLHWLGPVNADRTQFLDEAVALAGHGRGLVSLLPQEEFPFAFGPIGDIRDRDQVIKQVVQLRRGLDLLDQMSRVRADRVAVVGHDYGGMYATLLAAVDRGRIHSDVVLAADATWANWFITFFLDLPPSETGPYAASLSSLDPIRYISHGPSGGSLLQYATEDFFIPNDVAGSMAGQAGPNSTFLTYDTDHELALPQVRSDRDAFLVQTLSLG